MNDTVIRLIKASDTIINDEIELQRRKDSMYREVNNLTPEQRDEFEKYRRVPPLSSIIRR